MKIQQIAVFLQNKPGHLGDVCKTLKDNGINIVTLSLADTQQFGILRLIVSDVDLAVKVLKGAQFGVNITDVICVACGNVPGALSEILKHLANEEVFIEYMYAFSQGETANIVIKPNNIDKCIDALGRCDCNFLKL